MNALYSLFGSSALHKIQLQSQIFKLNTTSSTNSNFMENMDLGRLLQGFCGVPQEVL